MTYSLPDVVANWLWVGWACSKAPNPMVEIVALGTVFDSTRGFPGEGPVDSIQTPWFLADSSTQTLRDRKRRLSEPRGRHLSFEGGPPDCVPLARVGVRNRASTALGRFLQSRNKVGGGQAPVGPPSSITGTHLSASTRIDTTPVRREHLPQV